MPPEPYYYSGNKIMHYLEKIVDEESVDHEETIKSWVRYYFYDLWNHGFRLVEDVVEKDNRFESTIPVNFLRNLWFPEHIMCAGEVMN